MEVGLLEFLRLLGANRAQAEMEPETALIVHGAGAVEALRGALKKHGGRRRRDLRLAIWMLERD